jgi:hypothetical protein
LQEEAPFVEGFADEGEIALFEVAEAAVDEFGASTGSGLGEVGLFDEQGAQAAGGGIDGATQSGGAAANDEDIPEGGVVRDLRDGVAAIHEP